MGDDSSVFHILVFRFDGKDTANDTNDAIKEQGKIDNFKIIDAAILSSDADGKTTYHQKTHGGKVGGWTGAVVGGLIGILGGPAGVVIGAAAGGAAGGAVGHHVDSLPKSDLEEIAAALPPDTSALIALIEDEEAEQLVDQMSGYTTNVVTLTAGDELSGQIATAGAAQVTAKDS